MSNIKIFITYKNRKRLINNEIIIPIQTGRAIAKEIFSEMAGDDIGENISAQNNTYAELTAHYCVWKNQDKFAISDYVGFMHYRRLLNFGKNKNIKFLEQLDLSENLIAKECEGYDLIVQEKVGAYSPKLKGFASSIREHWNLHHEKEDLDFIIETIEKKYPDMKPAIKRVMNDDKAYWYNIFIMKTELFNEYCNWLFDILQTEHQYKNPDRIKGFLSERITNIFIEYKKEKKNIKIKELPMYYLPASQCEPQDENIIPVVLTSSDMYVPQTSVTILSAIKNCASPDKLKFIILADNIQEQNKRKLAEFIRKNGANVTFIPLTSNMLAPFTKISKPGHILSSTFARLIVPEVLAGYNKIIYLDSDMLVRGDISKLYETDLEDNYLGMVEDVARDYHSARMWNDKKHMYCNAGCLLLNASKLRQDNYMDIIKFNITQNADLFKFSDQDILNYAFNDKILRLDTKWNQHHIFHFMAKEFIPTDKDEYNKACNNPAIVHYVGSEKVWYNSSNRPYQDEYFKYWKSTPFYRNFRIDKFRDKDYKFYNINFDRKIIFQKKSGKEKLHINIIGIKFTFPKIKKLLSIEKTAYRKTIKFLNLKISWKTADKIYIDKLDNISRQISNLNCIIQAQTLHKDTFARYQNIFEGKNVVLICTGPTAKYFTPEDGMITVGVNGAIYLKQVNLDYLFTQDYAINQNNNKSLNQDIFNYKGNNCKKFYGIIPDKRLSEVYPIIGRIPLTHTYQENCSQYILEDIPFHNLAYDLSREPIGEFGGTPFSALQFILYCNPKRIYLVGCDCSSAGYAYSDKGFSAVYQKDIWIKYIKDFVDRYYPDTEIISVNPVGLKGLFKDVYTKEYIQNTHKEFNENLELLEIKEKINV